MAWARGRRFPNNETAARTVVRGPHPVSLATQPIIDVVTLANMIVPTRELRVGERNSLKFNGYGPANLQRWRGVQAGGSAVARPGFNTALPATTAPAAAQNAVLRAMQANAAGA